jgi:hypothetical protein
MKVLDISNIAIGNFDLVHKAVGVLLHDTGFMRYKKLTAENYYYWWYEVDDVRKANKKNFTYDWADMELTGKFDFLLSLVKYHNLQEEIHRIINNALNLLPALNDGININTGRRCYDEVWDMYYRHWKPEIKQLELFERYK